MSLNGTEHSEASDPVPLLNNSSALFHILSNKSTSLLDFPDICILIVYTIISFMCSGYFPRAFPYFPCGKTALRYENASEGAMPVYHSLYPR